MMRISMVLMNPAVYDETLETANRPIKTFNNPVGRAADFGDEPSTALDYNAYSVNGEAEA